MKKIKNGTVFHTEDNTILTCPTASYKYNYGTYRRSKLRLIVLAIIGIAGALTILFMSDDLRIQTIFATLIGGLLNVVVWIATSFVSDKIKQEQDEIDRLLYVVDRHIDNIHKSVYLVDSRTYSIEKVVENNDWHKFLWLMQLCVKLMSDKNIDSSKLVFRWEDKEETIEEYYSNCEHLIANHKLVLDEDHMKMVDWNLFEMESQLNCLRDKLLRYKTYLSSKNPPAPYEDYVEKNPESKKKASSSRWRNSCPFVKD